MCGYDPFWENLLSLETLTVYTQLFFQIHTAFMSGITHFGKLLLCYILSSLLVLLVMSPYPFKARVTDLYI